MSSFKFYIYIYIFAKKFCRQCWLVIDVFLIVFSLLRSNVSFIYLEADAQQGFDCRLKTIQITEQILGVARSFLLE
jgi:hypothetical protein